MSSHQMVIREPSGSDSRSIAKNSLQHTVVVDLGPSKIRCSEPLILDQPCVNNIGTTVTAVFHLEGQLRISKINVAPPSFMMHQ